MADLGPPGPQGRVPAPMGGPRRLEKCMHILVSAVWKPKVRAPLQEVCTCQRSWVRDNISRSLGGSFVLFEASRCTPYRCVARGLAMAVAKSFSKATAFWKQKLHL